MISKIYLIITSKFLKMMCYHCNSSNIIHTMYEVTHKSANGIMNSFCLVTSFLNCCLAWNPMDQNQTIEPGTEQMEWTEERQAPISKGVICPTHQSPLRVYDFADFHLVRQSEDYSSSQDAHQEGEERGWVGGAQGLSWLYKRNLSYRQALLASPNHLVLCHLLKAGGGSKHMEPESGQQVLGPNITNSYHIAIKEKTGFRRR